MGEGQRHPAEMFLHFPVEERRKEEGGEEGGEGKEEEGGGREGKKKEGMGRRKEARGKEKVFSAILSLCPVYQRQPIQQ